MFYRMEKKNVNNKFKDRHVTSRGQLEVSKKRHFDYKYIKRQVPNDKLLNNQTSL
jgi:hypothetical protein